MVTAEKSQTGRAGVGRQGSRGVASRTKDQGRRPRPASPLLLVYRAVHCAALGHDDVLPGSAWARGAEAGEPRGRRSEYTVGVQRAATHDEGVTQRNATHRWVGRGVSGTGGGACGRSMTVARQRGAVRGEVRRGLVRAGALSTRPDAVSTGPGAVSTGPGAVAPIRRGTVPARPSAASAQPFACLSPPTTPAFSPLTWVAMSS